MSRKRFTRIQEPSALGYQSLVDFVPDHEPYEVATGIEITSIDGGTRVVMTVEPLHDETWTQRLVDGRSNELENLGRLLGA